MKLQTTQRHRLALRFMLVSGVVTGAILIFIYALTRSFVHADFIDRINHRAHLEAVHYATPGARHVMASDSFSVENPEISIFSAGGELLYKRGSYPVQDRWLDKLDAGGVLNTKDNGYTTVGKRYVINNVPLYVFVSARDLPGRRELNFLLRAVIGGWLVSLILSYCGGLYFLYKALQPVTHVIEEVKQITEENLGHRLKLNQGKPNVEEIDELVVTFNDLLNRIEDAFIAQRRFLQNASHELKTPLTAIMAEVELALNRARRPEEYQHTLSGVLQETERLARATQGLLTLTRLEDSTSAAVELDNVDVIGLLNETLNVFSQHHPERKIVQRVELQRTVIRGNSHLLQTALLNVLDNAYKYSEKDIEVGLSRMDNTVIIAVRDRGIGIPADDLDRIRTPLVRAGNVGGVPGAGLGLALVDRIIKAHKGRIELISREGEGTTCLIRLFKTMSE